MSERGITLHPSTCRLMEVTDGRGESKRLFVLTDLHRGQSKMQARPRSCCRLFADCGFVRDGGSTRQAGVENRPGYSTAVAVWPPVVAAPPPAAGSSPHSREEGTSGKTETGGRKRGRASERTLRGRSAGTAYRAFRTLHVKWWLAPKSLLRRSQSSSFSFPVQRSGFCVLSAANTIFISDVTHLATCRSD